MAVIQVASGLRTTVREAAHHYADQQGGDLEYPEAQLIGHLVTAYCERHGEDFDRKPPSNNGQVPLFIYLGSHSTNLKPQIEDDGDDGEDEDDGEVEDSEDGNEDDVDSEGREADGDALDTANAGPEDDEGDSNEDETNADGYDTSGKLTFTMSDGPSEEDSTDE